MFDLDRFIADCRNALAERSGLALQEVVARAVSAPNSIFAALGEPERQMNDVFLPQEQQTFFHRPVESDG